MFFEQFNFIESRVKPRRSRRGYKRNRQNLFSVVVVAAKYIV